MSSALAESSAERAVAKLAEMSADLRACAIVGPGGEVLAKSEPAGWGEHVTELWEAADSARGDAGTATQVHVATDAGELFASREDGISAVALADRFALASLMFCDLRAALREIADASAPEGS